MKSSLPSEKQGANILFFNINFTQTDLCLPIKMAI